MAHVVFLRAANVGGNNVFRPTQLVAALRHLDMVSVGAAGTFVVRGKATAAAIRREIRAKLTFEPGIMVHTAREILDLVEAAPFKDVAISKDLRGWVAALDGRPRARPKLPIMIPAGKAWAVRFDRVEGAFALGLWRRTPKLQFPNQPVEDVLGVPATTRYWETLEKVAKLLA